MIKYEHSNLAWDRHLDKIRELASQPGIQSVCEVGGGANPLLTPEFLAEHGLEYTVIDISETELAKAPEGLHKVVGDVSSEGFSHDKQYDFVFSRALAEHVKSGRNFHRNVFKLLKPGGRAFHFFPTLFAFPFLVNKLMPEALAERVLHMLTPGREREGKDGKFPAYYSWCRGPMKSQLRKFEEIGYRIEEYIGFFGHEGYYRKLKPVLFMHRKISSFYAKHPVPLLTSYAFLTLRKPE